MSNDLNLLKPIKSLFFSLYVLRIMNTIAYFRCKKKYIIQIKDKRFMVYLVNFYLEQFCS